MNSLVLSAKAYILRVEQPFERFAYQDIRPFSICGCAIRLKSKSLEHITGAGLDSSSARSANFHPPTLAQKSAGRNTHHPKTEVVVPIIRRVAVAQGRATVARIVVPGTAPHQLG